MVQLWNIFRPSSLLVPAGRSRGVLVEAHCHRAMGLIYPGRIVTGVLANRPESLFM